MNAILYNNNSTLRALCVSCMCFIMRPRPDVLLFVLLRDLDVPAVRLQLVSRHLTQDLLIHREKHLQPAVLDVIIPDTQLERHCVTRSCISDARFRITHTRNHNTVQTQSSEVIIHRIQKTTFEPEFTAYEKHYSILE